MPAANLRPIASLALAASLAACGNANSVPVKAEIVSIDRKCSFMTVESIAGRKVMSEQREMKSCDTTDEFEDLRSGSGRRARSIVGKGTLAISYTSPVDQSQQSAEIAIDGNDDAFYAHRGDTIRVWVDKTDPGKARL